MNEEIQKAAINAVQLLESWSGDTDVPYSDFREVHNRALKLNYDIMSENLVVLTKKEHEELLANQKKVRTRNK